MALGGGTVVASFATTNNVATYRCPSSTGTFTPAANAWILVAVSWSGPSAGAISNIPTISDTLAALSWSALLGRRDFSGGTQSGGLFIAKVGGSPAAMAINVAFAGENQSGASIIITQITGSNATNIIAQSKTAELVSGLSLSATLDNALATGSATYAVCTNDLNAAMTPRASWTEVDDAGYGTPANRLETQIRFSVSETTGSWTKAAGVAAGGISVFELLENDVGGTTFTKTITGTLSMGGTLTRRLAAKKTVAGSLSATSTLGRVKAFQRTLTGQLRLQGVVRGQASKRITGVLSMAGTLRKGTAKGLSGVLSMTSTLGRLKSFSRALTGVLSLSGALTRFKSAGRLLAGVLSLQGAVSKRIALKRTLGGVLSFAGTVSRRLALQRTLTGVLSVTSVLGRVKIPGGAVFFKTLTGILSFGSTLTREYTDNPEPVPGADPWLLRMRRRWGGK